MWRRTTFSFFLPFGSGWLFHAFLTRVTVATLRRWVLKRSAFLLRTATLVFGLLQFLKWKEEKKQHKDLHLWLMKYKTKGWIHYAIHYSTYTRDSNFRSIHNIIFNTKAMNYYFHRCLILELFQMIFSFWIICHGFNWKREWFLADDYN